MCLTAAGNDMKGRAASAGALALRLEAPTTQRIRVVNIEVTHAALIGQFVCVY